MRILSLRCKCSHEAWTFLKMGTAKWYVRKTRSHSKLREKDEQAVWCDFGSYWLFPLGWKQLFPRSHLEGGKYLTWEFVGIIVSNNIGENLVVNYRATYTHTYTLPGREKEMHNVIRRGSLICSVFLKIVPRILFLFLFCKILIFEIYVLQSWTQSI